MNQQADNVAETGGIKDISNGEMPREKALKHGIKSLSTTELMAIIFATGVSGKPVTQLCKEILDDHKGHLALLARMTPAEMHRRYKGVGTAKALSLLAALELGTRSAADARTLVNPRIMSSHDAYTEIADSLVRLPHEVFWVIYLSRSGEVITKACVSQGGMSATVVDVRIIMRRALECYASSVILCHNHPSGNLSPSVQDDSLTRRIVQAASYFDIAVNDHLIVTDAGYYSYRDEGRMPSPTRM